MPELLEPRTPANLRLYHGSLTPIQSEIRPVKIIGFDSEDDTRGQPLSFTFHDGAKAFYTRFADEAIEFIYNYPERAVFCAHNLEYDIGNLFKECDFRFVKEMVYASKLLRVTLFASKHTFLNSSSFFPGSLKKMGDLIGLPKLEGDSLSEAYAIRDAEIVQVFMAKMQDRLNMQGVNLGLSIGQLSMSIFRANHLKKKQRTYNSPNCLRAYYGGRVEMFFKGVVKGPVYVADINSSYPDVMYHQEYPDTTVVEASSIFTHTYGIGHFKIRVPETCFIPPLPFRSETGRLFFPTGEIEGWWTYAEVRFAVEKCGCEILAEYDGEGCRRGVRPFESFIGEHYDARQAMKKRKERNKEDLEAVFEDLHLKLIMNNLYGKFAQHKDGNKMTRVKLSKRVLEKMDASIESKIGPFYSYRVPRKRPPRTANYMWGVYVTSYARLSLLQKIMAVHAKGGKLLYCDTDSIMFTGEAAKEALVFGDGLGKMSLETYDLGIYRASKGYLMCEQVSCQIKTRKSEYQIKKVACKGVPTHYAHDFILKGMAKFLKPMRLKEAEVRLHAGANAKKDAAFFSDIGVNVWRDVEKSMRSIYIKRKGDRGVTYPVNVLDIPSMEERAFGAVESWENELGNEVVIPPIAKADTFRNVKVPDNWFSVKYQLDAADAFFDSQESPFLKREDCLDLMPGDAWFRAEILERRNGLYGSYFLMRLREYMGKNVARKNMLVSVSEKFFKKFGPDFILVKKSIAFFLEEKYLVESRLKIRVDILNP